MDITDSIQKVMRLGRHLECGNSVCLPVSGSSGLALARGPIIQPIGGSREANSELASFACQLTLDSNAKAVRSICFCTGTPGWLFESPFKDAPPKFTYVTKTPRLRFSASLSKSKEGLSPGSTASSGAAQELGAPYELKGDWALWLGGCC
jgi:hypothetical protein